MENKVSKPRYREIDLAKGTGIILVVLGHSLKQTQVDAKWMRVLLTVIYSFHMPLFFTLSGFVSVKTLKMKTIRERMDYIKNRAIRLLVPYFVIGVIYIPVKLKMNAFAVKPFTGKDSLLLLIGQNPDVSLWFLYILFVVSAVSALLINETNFRSYLYGSAALCVAAWWVDIPVNTLKYLFFFLAGIWVRLKYEDARKEGRDSLFDDGIAGAVLTLVLFLAFNRLFFRYGLNILRLGSSVCGVYLTLWCSYTIVSHASQGRLTLLLEKMGLLSMDIYILHEPIMTVVKLALWNKMGLNYVLCTLLIFLCALLFPIPLSHGIIRRVPVFRLLLLGERKDGRKSA